MSLPLRLLSVFLIICFAFVAADMNESKTTTDTLVTMYVVGSDLESGDGIATTDLLGVVYGYTNSTADQDSVDFVVAYGGSDIPGWIGMKIEDIDGLIKDSQNGVFGDEGLELFSDETLDMGDPETLKMFLDYVNEHYKSDKNIIIFWNHGSAYNGFGFTTDDTMLTVQDIASNLKDSDTVWDIIGFDACLMNSLETLNLLNDSGKYFLGSEEIETGGWIYENWVGILAKNSTAPEIGKEIISTYMADDDKVNTLSLIDLDKIPDVVSSLEMVSSKLNSDLDDESGIYTLSHTFKNTTKYGIWPGNIEKETTMDLGVFADNVKNNIPILSDDADNLIEAIDNAVIESEYGKFVPESKGISILSPTAVDEDLIETSGDILAITPSWMELIEEYFDKESDMRTPSLNISDDGRYSLDDPFGVADVYLDYYIYDNETATLLGSDPVEPDDEGYYSIPEWDGIGLYLSNPNESTDYALLGLNFETTLSDDIFKYTTEIDLTRDGETDSAILSLYYNKLADSTEMIVTPYTMSGDEILFDKDQTELEPGDVITTYASSYDLNNNESDWVKIGTITFNEDTTYSKQILPDGIYSVGLSTNYASNDDSYSEVDFYEINESVVTKTDHIIY